MRCLIVSSSFPQLRFASSTTPTRERYYLNLYIMPCSSLNKNSCPIRGKRLHKRNVEGSTRTRLRIAEDGSGEGRESSQALYRWGSHGLEKSSELYSLRKAVRYFPQVGMEVGR
jgi:hypothetical protein